MKHVIIEGPDGAGKTRLARWVCDRYGMAYHHEGPPPAGVPALLHYEALLSDATVPTVFDRLHLGEIVYPPLLRGCPGLAPSEVRLLSQIIIDQGSVIVGCLPPWETCLENTRSKEELIKDELILRCAYDAWTVVFKNEQLFANGQLYDYTRDAAFVLREV